MFDLEVRTKKEKETGEKGRFVIEPLPGGYGVTLGTALRRVLLSSLPGGAISEIQIQGVSHAFTTIKGIKEDVVEIMLNLKRVRFQVKGEGPFEGTIEVKGKKEITGVDIQVSSEAKVFNPDLKIATLTDKGAKLSASLKIERGFGYRQAEEVETGKVGVIPMDSVFSPVLNVSFAVEETRVGRQTGLDRLVLDIETDGTIKPSQALEEASRILSNFLASVSGKEKTARAKPKAEGEAGEGPAEEVRQALISEIGLSPRTLNTLESASVKTVGGLIQKSAEDLLGIDGFGLVGLSEVKKSLKKLGASLKE